MDYHRQMVASMKAEARALARFRGEWPASRERLIACAESQRRHDARFIEASNALGMGVTAYRDFD